MEIQGYVVIALTLILLGYLLPHLVRSRQLLLDSRVEDRFSGDLRVLATAGPGASAGGPSADPGAHHGQPAARPYLHDPARRPEAPAVNRPHARTERASGDARALAAARAARAARLSRRAAAVRRRRILTVTLLLLSVAAWAAVGIAAAHWGLAVGPTLLLGTVLELGRRTATKTRANDRRDRSEMARLEERLRAVSQRNAAEVAARTPAARSAAPRPTAAPRTAGASPAAASTSATGVSPAAASEAAVGATAAPSPVADADADADAAKGASSPAEARDGAVVSAGTGTSAEAAPERSVSGSEETDGVAAVVPRRPDHVPAPEVAGPAVPEPASTWTPVPVPVPSYTLKPAAPRRDVDPYVSDDADSSLAAVPQRPISASPAAAAAALSEPVAVTLDLDAVLARRRAAGE
ncbi:hypothetical protein FE374_03205 [Georgenia yuyongxinii]|uniref:Uncharacterized protein n=1 Tax=Georgenia yuyongxinii TaxID=2589797 RepID=A0A5B8C100_9MICO|nr:hypothetical protein [Georgenia yuyongxinii]QDC23767.1 hypothetical protein FE374_03205 [Georgenia yuyongxinii]